MRTLDWRNDYAVWGHTALLCALFYPHCNYCSLVESRRTAVTPTRPNETNMYCATANNEPGRWSRHGLSPTDTIFKATEIGSPNNTTEGREFRLSNSSLCQRLNLISCRNKCNFLSLRIPESCCK